MLRMPLSTLNESSPPRESRTEVVLLMRSLVRRARLVVARNQTTLHYRVMNEMSHPFGYSELQSCMGSIRREQGKVILGEVTAPTPDPRS